MQCVKLNQKKNFGEWGFDLTDIPPDKFEELLKGAIGARFDIREIPRPSFYVWRGYMGEEDIDIITKHNPLMKRGDEIGYAGYIGIEGSAELVRKAADFIRENAEYIKGESPNEREFI